jgi:predicted nucleic acid-binding protein
VKLLQRKKSTPKVDEEKYADADEESVEIYKQAKALAKKENISFKDALLKIKEI